MKPGDCDNLDAFLIGELSHDAASCFAAHLALCDDCRTALDEQRWIDELLHSPTAAGLEAPPVAVLGSFHVAVERRRQRKFVAAGLAAAAAVVVAVGWTALLLNQSMNQPIGGTVTTVAADRVAQQQPAPAPAPIETDEEPPRATFVGGPDVLVVPVASRHPNVTIVQVYPVYQPEYAVQASAALPSVTDNFLWIDDLTDLNDLNGG